MAAGATPQTRPDRLVIACTAAIHRLDGPKLETDAFAALGEPLFWLSALAEENDRLDEPLLMGLAWARNRIAHGVVITAPLTWRRGAELGQMILGRDKLGAVSGYAWLPRHRLPVGPRDRPDRRLAKAYDEEVAGRQVLPLMREALTLARQEVGDSSRG